MPEDAKANSRGKGEHASNNDCQVYGAWRNRRRHPPMQAHNGQGMSWSRCDQRRKKEKDYFHGVTPRYADPRARNHIRSLTKASVHPADTFGTEQSAFARCNDRRHSL